MNSERALGISFVVACAIIGGLVGFLLPTALFGQEEVQVVAEEEEVAIEEVAADPVVQESIEIQVVEHEPAGDYPVVPSGVYTWQEVLILALDWPEYAEALFSQGSVSSWQELTELADSEEYDTIRTLKKGTRIVNSYYRDGAIRFVEEVLTRDRSVLHNRSGEPVILTSCGNPIRVLPPEKKVTPPPAIISPPAPPPTGPPVTPPPPPPPPPTCPDNGGPGPEPPTTPPPSGDPCPPSGGPGADPD